MTLQDKLDTGSHILRRLNAVNQKSHFARFGVWGKLSAKGTLKGVVSEKRQISRVFFQFIAGDLASRFLCHWQYSQLHNSQYHQTTNNVRQKHVQDDNFFWKGPIVINVVTTVCYVRRRQVNIISILHCCHQLGNVTNFHLPDLELRCNIFHPD